MSSSGGTPAKAAKPLAELAKRQPQDAAVDPGVRRRVRPRRGCDRVPADEGAKRGHVSRRRQEDRRHRRHRARAIHGDVGADPGCRASAPSRRSRWLLAACAAALAQPAPAPAIAAQAYLLLDVASGQVIAAENADERRDPASLTKLMTAYLAFAALRDKAIVPSQLVNVSTAAWRAEGSRMFIEPRKAVTVDELLRGMIVQSGNDASIALAELVAGSEAAFAEKMNREAARLGLANTHFDERDRAVAPAALLDRDRSRAARGGADPRLSRLLPALFAARVPLQQHHAAQPQPPAVDRSVRRRHEDRAYGRRGLVPHRVGQARRAAPARRRAGRGVGRGARRRGAEAPQLRIPGVRPRAALPVGQARRRALRVWKGEAKDVGAGFVADKYRHAAEGQGGEARALDDGDASRCWRRWPRASRWARSRSRSKEARSRNFRWWRSPTCRPPMCSAARGTRVRLWFK